jgi:AraC-like DNA-binding protein
VDGSTPHSRLQVFRHDTPLGCWSVAVWQPAAQLAGVVATMWFGEGAVSYQRDRILPSGQSQLLINLGPTQYRIEPGPPEVRVPFHDLWYSALHQGPIDTEAPHGSALLGVAFASAGSFPWLGLPQHLLADRVGPLADQLGDGVLALREQLLNTPDLAARFLCVEAWIQRRIEAQRRGGIHPAVRWAVARIAASGGQVAVEDLARQTGYTRKHLNQLFLTQVGLSAKALARVQRFRNALQLLGSNETVPWTELAALCGYYDQSHLVRDFRAFSGFAPAQFLRQGRPDAGSVVVR